jgi:hypothetical protein
MKIHHLVPLTMLIVLSLPSVFANLNDNVDAELIPNQAEETQLETDESDNTLNLYEEMEREQEEVQADQLEQNDPEDFSLQEEETSDF